MGRRGGGRDRVRPVAGGAPRLRAGTWRTATGTVALLPDRDAGDGSWTLWVNGVPSSPVHPDPRVLGFEYLQWMADAVDVVLADAAHGDLAAPAPLRAVHLGGGALALPRWLEAARPGSRQVVVELDGDLARLVREWLALPGSPRLRISVGDARERLAVLAGRAPGGADVLVRDVFAGDATPRHLTTAEFLTGVVTALRPGGLYLANVVDRTSRVGLRAELATLRAAFAHTALATEPAVLRGRRWGNAVLLGSDAPLPVAALVRRLAGGAAPATVVHGEALDQVVGSKPALHDLPGAPGG